MNAITDPALLDIAEALRLCREHRRKLDIERALLADENRELKARIRAYERAANGQV